MFLDPESELWRALSAISADEGLVVYDIEAYSGLLRVFVEKRVDSTQVESVSSNECALLCKRLVTFCRVHGLEHGVGSNPQLEVSSPGLGRHLRLEEHFSKAVGGRVKVQYSLSSDSSLKERQTVEGKLEAFDVGVSSIRLDSDSVVSLHISSVIKAWKMIPGDFKNVVNLN